jgi:hypothetical protein
MVLNMLYLGVGSCRQYYEYGRKGEIVPHLCQALQFFSYEPCGCGVGDPIPPYGERTAATSYPTVAPRTLAPTPYPTVAPSTLSPTSYPTVAPSTFSPTSYPTVAPSTFSPTEVPTGTPSSIPTTLNPTFDPTDGPSYTPTSAPSSQFLRSPAPVSNSPPVAPSYSPAAGLENVFHRTPNTDGKDGIVSLAGEQRGGHGNGRMLKGVR